MILLVMLSRSVLSVVQSDWSTDTPWLMQQLCSRRSGTSQNWICMWLTIYMFLKESSWNPSSQHAEIPQHDHLLPVVLPGSIILPPLAFIPTRKEIHHMFQKNYFNFCCFLMIVWIWNCVTWNCISVGVSIHWWLER